MLLTAFLTVSFGIVNGQSVPTVSEPVPFVTDLSNPTVTALFHSPVPTVTEHSDPTETAFYERIPLVNNVLTFARRHLNIRYRSGGTTTHGFDCSGFTRFCYSHFGISLPHSSAAQGSVGQAVEKAHAQPGDLILFKGHSAAGNRIGHVGLITEVVGNRIKFIHSAWNGGVRYDYLNADYYQRRFMGVRRVVSLLAQR